MTGEGRSDALRRSVAELVALERSLAEVLAAQAGVVREHPEAAAAVQRFGAMAESHRDALEAYLADGPRGDEDRAVLACLFGSASGGADGPRPTTISGVLRAASAAFSYAAASYAALCEAAFRLYDPPLRQLAPRHLGAHAEATRATNRLLAAVVAWELEQEGLSCHCICPMCSIGACGCVALGAEFINEAWRPAVPGEEEPGFPLQPPRPNSALALAGVRGGERLLAVDGQEVRSLDDVQAALRKHHLGEEVQLLVRQGSEAPREIRVTHVGDYPPSR